MLTILSGSVTRPLFAASPFLMASTNSMPLTTSPSTVYRPFSVRRFGEHDEELRVGAVRIVRARHADDAAHERRVGELGFEIGKLGAARARAGRVAGLRHETVDDAVEHDAVVKALARERLQPLDMVRREIGPKLDRHGAVLQLKEERIFRIVTLGQRRRRKES